MNGAHTSQLKGLLVYSIKSYFFGLKNLCSKAHVNIILFFIYSSRHFSLSEVGDWSKITVTNGYQSWRVKSAVIYDGGNNKKKKKVNAVEKGASL